MIAVTPPTKGLAHVEMTWMRPLYNPEKFKFTYSCIIEPKGFSYTTEGERILSSNSTSARVSGLRPQTVCKLKLIAVYNPASIDPGITVTARTLEEEERE